MAERHLGVRSPGTMPPEPFRLAGAGLGRDPDTDMISMPVRRHRNGPGRLPRVRSGIAGPSGLNPEARQKSGM